MFRWLAAGAVVTAGLVVAVQAGADEDQVTRHRVLVELFTSQG